MNVDTVVHLKLGMAIDLTGDDKAIINSVLKNKRVAAAGEIIVHGGQTHNLACVVLEGWAFRFQMFEDGRRQIPRLFLPGDFIGLSASLLNIHAQSVVALTDVSVSFFDTRYVAELVRTSPRLWLAALWSYSRDRSIMEERIASIGRRNAYGRLAHIIMELYLRLEFVGRATGDEFILPLTQEHLADLLGLTNIHVNRILGRLKRDGLVATDGKTVKILSREKLMKAADFDPEYISAIGARPHKKRRKPE